MTVVQPRLRETAAAARQPQQQQQQRRQEQRPPQQRTLPFQRSNGSPAAAARADVVSDVPIFLQVRATCMNDAPEAPGGVRADARVEHRLHKTPVLEEEDARAEILLPSATAVVTSRRGTREHPDQDNGRRREDRDQAEVPGSLYPDSFLRRRLRWGGASALRES